MRGIGIDFGAANSLLATFDGNNIDVRLADEHAHPSIVWYQKRRQPRVGIEAKDAYMTLLGNPDNAFIKSVKRQLATDHTVTLATRTISTEIATEVIFNFLLKDAGVSPKPDDRFVIAIPKSLTAEQRREIRRAAKAAGFSPQFFVPESFAAIVGYAERESADATNHRRVLVVDWGAGVVEITLVLIDGDCIIELASCTLDDIAGNDIDVLLAEKTLERFMEHNDLSRQAIEEAMPDLDPMEALLGVTEQAKITLGSDEKAAIEKANFCTIDKTGYDVNEVFTRDEFEGLIEPLVDRALKETQKIMSSCGLKPSDVDLCLLIGECSKMPLIEQRFQHLLAKKRVVTPASSSTLVAEGAALIAHRNFVPRLASDICVLSADGREHTLVPAGTAMLPKEGEPNAPVEFICVDPRAGKALTIVQSRSVIPMPDPAKPSKRSKDTEAAEGIRRRIEMDIDWAEAHRVYSLPRLFIKAAFDECQVFRLLAYTNMDELEDAIDLEVTHLDTALFTVGHGESNEIPLLTDSSVRPIAPPVSGDSVPDTGTSNVVPVKDGRRRIWANVPVQLLMELEPQIRDVRLMEKYLTSEQREEYLSMLPPAEVGRENGDVADSDDTSSNRSDHKCPGNRVDN